jgi:hypothetical protein
MKVIDKTPYQNEQGAQSLIQRLQGVWEYGFSWQAELDAQRTVITQLDRVLEKGYTLIRNLNLENSKIIEPLILVGPAGVFVLYVTPTSGFFEAKGDQWNIVDNDRRRQAPVNLLTRVARLARALQVYLNRQGSFLPGMVEPVLVAANPRVHVETLRPIVRVVLSDGVKQFAASLLQTRPILKSDQVPDLVDHIVNPRPKRVTAAEAAAELLKPTKGASATEEGTPAEGAQQADAPQRARTIFHAAEEAKPFDPADLSFQFDEKASSGVPAALRESSPSQRLDQAATMSASSVSSARGGLKPGQWFILVVMILLECVVLAGFIYAVMSSTL